ncbi:MAG: TolC family protein [Sphingobacteriales bacterium]|nr:TolC family protein [Sphingobacteriales bacterium]
MKNYDTLKLTFFFVLIGFSTISNGQEVTISDLFSGLEKNAVAHADELKVKQAKANQTIVTSQLYPAIDGFGKYDYSSIPSGLYPLPPNDLLPLVQNQNTPQPFSTNIFRVGAGISMPIYNQSLFTLAKQAKQMVISSQEQQKINSIKNQSVLVANNANLNYIENLAFALEKKKQSLIKTKEIINAKVSNGRAAASLLYNIDNALDEIQITLNDLALQKNSIQATVFSLTNIELQYAVKMDQISSLNTKNIGITKPLQEKIKADELALKAEKQILLPSIGLLGNYSFNFAKAYNNNKSINREFVAASVVLKVPIFNNAQNAKIKKSKLIVEESTNDLEKLTNEFHAQAKQLENNLLIYENSIATHKNAIINKEALRLIAIKKFELDQISIEDYLKYEDDLVLEKAKLYETEAQKWQTLTKLAVIYGTDLKTIVK